MRKLIVLTVLALWGPVGPLLAAGASTYLLYVWGWKPSDVAFWLVPASVLGLFLVWDLLSRLASRKRGIDRRVVRALIAQQTADRLLGGRKEAP